MTSVSSYQLLQCSSCGQRHILPNYGTLNFTFGAPPVSPKPEDLRVCQRCSAQKPLNHFILLRIVYKPKSDNTPKWFRPIRKLIDNAYKESEPHPAQLYPNLASTPFDPEIYYSPWVKEHMIKGSYPLWFKELASLK